MDAKTKKRSIGNKNDTDRPSFDSVFEIKPDSTKDKLARSDIIQAKPIKKHQLWISSLAHNQKRKSSLNNSQMDYYLNMSSFNISDDISHIIPSFSSKMVDKNIKKQNVSFSKIKESVASQSNFMKNNQSISAIDAESSSYNFIENEDPVSFFGDMNQDTDFPIELDQCQYRNNNNINLTLSKVINNRLKSQKYNHKRNRGTYSFNTLQNMQNEFSEQNYQNRTKTFTTTQSQFNSSKFINSGKQGKIINTL